MTINPNQYYRPEADELRQIAAKQTLAAWRHKGSGPSYTFSGSRVLYLGSDLLAWLESHRVNTSPAACETSPQVSGDCV